VTTISGIPPALILKKQVDQGQHIQRQVVAAAPSYWAASRTGQIGVLEEVIDRQAALYTFKSNRILM
jgi:hypothetical protein